MLFTLRADTKLSSLGNLTPQVSVAGVQGGSVLETLALNLRRYWLLQQQAATSQGKDGCDRPGMEGCASYKFVIDVFDANENVLGVGG